MRETTDFLAAIAAFVRQYVVLGRDELAAVALWVVHTHAFDAAEATPYLSVTSPERESGKTRLLEVLEFLVARPWFTGRVTAAVLARKVDAEKPTLLLDESDAAFAGEKEYAETLRGILNTGYRRSGKSSLCTGQGAALSYTDLSTFCPKAIAGIGNLPDTVASRSISIRLKRRAPGEEIQPFYLREAAEEAEPLHTWLVSWAENNVDALTHLRPPRPDGVSDRGADVWEPLFAIADHAGGEWSARARAAAVALAGQQDDQASIRVRLLADCQRALNGHDRLATKDLIAVLSEDEEAPWSGWHKGSPISPRALAGLLEPFGIRSRTIRLESGETPKGYMRDSFEDAWKRYSVPNPPIYPPQRHNPHQKRDWTTFLSATRPPLWRIRKSPQTRMSPQLWRMWRIETGAGGRSTSVEPPMRNFWSASVMSERPSASQRLSNPEAVLTRSDLRELGYERRCIDAIFRACPIESWPDYGRPMLRVADFLEWRERNTYRGDRVRPA